jgi:hypothetical protein
MAGIAFRFDRIRMLSIDSFGAHPTADVPLGNITAPKAGSLPPESDREQWEALRAADFLIQLIVMQMEERSLLIECMNPEERRSVIAFSLRRDQALETALNRSMNHVTRGFLLPEPPSSSSSSTSLVERFQPILTSIRALLEKPHES